MGALLMLGCVSLVCPTKQVTIEQSCRFPQWIKILPSSGFDNMYGTYSPLYLSTNIAQRLPHSVEILPELRYGENLQVQGLCYNTWLRTEEVPSRPSLVLFS
jgi:hypothetical protein